VIRIDPRAREELARTLADPSTAGKAARLLIEDYT